MKSIANKLFVAIPMLFIITLCFVAVGYGTHFLITYGADGFERLFTKSERIIVPYDLDQRPVPADTSAENLLPQRIGVYRLIHKGELSDFVAKLGIADGLVDGIEAEYAAGDDSVHVIVLRSGSLAEGRDRLSLLSGRLNDASGFKVTKTELVGQHPFVKYRHGGWETGPYGVAWANEGWLFFVYAGTSETLDDVAGSFPY